MALRFLRQAAAADLEVDANSAGGIHIAGLGGVWQAVVLGFAGLDLSGDTISISPRLPAKWSGMCFTVRWRGRPVQIRIASAMVRITVADGGPMDVRIAGVLHSLQAGTALEVSLEPGAAPL
jgi:trehalose/maltose hydrolase-like predicted phosphorylase